MNYPFPDDPERVISGTLVGQQSFDEPLTLSLGNLGAKPYSERTFIDLFAGAGCLSLGLMSSGWRGIFAVEKNAMAFETLSHNLIEGTNGSTYEWPEWFPKKPCTVGRLAGTYRQQLLQLRGTVTMIVGGPPCQGFSMAGRRNKKDTRNSLFKAYMRIVETVQPLFLLLENVHGITVEFGKKARGKRKVGRPPEPYSQRIARALNKAGYEVQSGLLRAVDFGVPQFRPRYFLMAARRGISPSLKDSDPFVGLDALREEFLRSKGLPLDRPISVKEALSDLETVHRTEQCVDSPGFLQGTYALPTTRYQLLMRGNLQGSSPDSHRLANHRPETVARFGQILATCRRGVQLNQADRERFGLKKHCTVPLHPGQPSHTLTTLPDDIIHYSEARILTVREYARLQSIPDWFQFRGVYTTGGDRRVRECPRYTQAGNAVPPFIGEAIGTFFTGLHEQFLRSSPSVQPLKQAYMTNLRHFSGPAIQHFRMEMLEWYPQHGRRFPWRKRSASNYDKIVAEVLLQRTRAETVAGFFPHFISRYPSWRELATANENELIALIRPVGLWRRRSTTLINLAREMVKLNGRFPEDREQLEALPGVGQYIANSIMLLCHNRTQPLLDINMARVLERYFGPRTLSDIRYDPYLQRLAKLVVDCPDSIVLNWAILDFAAGICSPHRPKCSKCELASECRFVKEFGVKSY